MTTPVSVIVPVRNRLDFLVGAVDSLIATGYPGLEIVIVDDGSSDDTLNGARELERGHSGRIRVFQHEDGGNHGPGASRNLGVRVSTGAYVCFLDSDDVALPNRFRVAVPLLDGDPTIDGVAERYLVQEEDGAPRETHRDSLLPDVAPGPGIRWNTNSILLRRRCFVEAEGFSERLRTCEDLALWAKLILSAHIVAGGPDPVVVCRRHAGNTDVILQNSLLAYLEALGWTHGRDLERERIAALREVIWGKMLFVCDRLMRRGESRLAIRILGASARANPHFLLRTLYWKNLQRAILASRVPTVETVRER
ncbi:MAG TPA: glycosyltransferase family 2 protein [Gemmatimonadota bacterium]|jgi:glycosyltransferase involved in cell wall biosynthesis|nr:glycosyltransferase family 2 protein [Gemmatimonadota bacterium]